MIDEKQEISNNELPTTSSAELRVIIKGNECNDVVSTMFTTSLKSLHGRRVKPTSKMFKSLDELGTSIDRLPKEGFKFNFKNLFEKIIF